MIAKRLERLTDDEVADIWVAFDDEDAFGFWHGLVTLFGVGKFYHRWNESVGRVAVKFF